MKQNNLIETEAKRQLTQLKEEGIALGLSFSIDQLNKFDLYLQHLLLGNRTTNLFSVHDTNRLARRHLLESLAWIPKFPAELSSPIMDIGTGAGFPGIPLAVYFPSIEFFLLESKMKKALFLERVIHKLELKNTHLIVKRAETLKDDPLQMERYYWILARAVAPLAVLIDWSFPLLQKGGSLLAFKGEKLERELEQIDQLYSKFLKISANIIDYDVRLSEPNGNKTEIRRLVQITRR